MTKVHSLLNTTVEQAIEALAQRETTIKAGADKPPASVFVKTAFLQEAGKQVLGALKSPTAQNALLGAGIGGAAGYMTSGDDENGNSNALSRTLGGAAAGAGVGAGSGYLKGYLDSKQQPPKGPQVSAGSQKFELPTDSNSEEFKKVLAAQKNVDNGGKSTSWLGWGAEKAPGVAAATAATAGADRLLRPLEGRTTAFNSVTPTELGTAAAGLVGDGKKLESLMDSVTDKHQVRSMLDQLTHSPQAGADALAGKSGIPPHILAALKTQVASGNGTAPLDPARMTRKSVLGGLTGGPSRIDTGTMRSGIGTALKRGIPGLIAGYGTDYLVSKAQQAVAESQLRSALEQHAKPVN